MAEKAENEAQAPAEEYVSQQSSVNMWAVIARFLHEGGGIVTLHKAWDRSIEGFNIVPIYAGQDPGAMKPNVWTNWRSELKAPLAGHTFIRDYAEVVETVSLQTPGGLSAVESEHALTSVEARRRYLEGEPGLVALLLRVYHLPRSYKLYDVASRGADGELVSLPFDVERKDLVPAVEDGDFERRLARIRAALP